MGQRGTLQISRGLQPGVYRAARWGMAAGWDSFLESWVEIRIMEDILLSGQLSRVQIHKSHLQGPVLNRVVLEGLASYRNRWVGP